MRLCEQQKVDGRAYLWKQMLSFFYQKTIPTLYAPVDHLLLTQSHQGSKSGKASSFETALSSPRLGARTSEHCYRVIRPCATRLPIQILLKMASAKSRNQKMSHLSIFCHGLSRGWPVKDVYFTKIIFEKYFETTCCYHDKDEVVKRPWKWLFWMISF